MRPKSKWSIFVLYSSVLAVSFHQYCCFRIINCGSNKIKTIENHRIRANNETILNVTEDSTTITNIEIWCRADHIFNECLLEHEKVDASVFEPVCRQLNTKLCANASILCLNNTNHSVQHQVSSSNNCKFVFNQISKNGR